MANETNAHPQVSNSGKLAIVHKGIVENYASLKEKLEEENFVFHSDTDTEVLVNWIEHIQNLNDVPLINALKLALNQVGEAFSIMVLNKEENALYAPGKGVQLLLGEGEKEEDFIVATDT